MMNARSELRLPICLNPRWLESTGWRSILMSNFSRNRGVRQPLQIRIPRLLRAIMSDLRCGMVVMRPDFGMAVRKDKSETEIMSMDGSRRKIDPDFGRGISDNKSIINAALILIQKYPHAGRPGNLGVFRIK